MFVGVGKKLHVRKIAQEINTRKLLSLAQMNDILVVAKTVLTNAVQANTCAHALVH